MRIDFYLRYSTQFGQTLSLLGDLPQLGNNNQAEALPMKFFNETFWHASIEVELPAATVVRYRYMFTDADGTVKLDAEKDRKFTIAKGKTDVVVFDSWNDESFYENAFYTAPFKKVFFRHSKHKAKKAPNGTHQFKIKAPLLRQDEVLCLAGNVEQLNNWSTTEPLLLHQKADWWVLDIDLSAATFPIAYKYGIFNTATNSFALFEEGDNRTLHYDVPAEKCTIIHDGFFRQQQRFWKGAGVAIPVFSLRSNNSFGVGEFSDLKLLADWAKETGLKMLQLLPINDTSATFSWKDSYPYAAISAFALHPIYLNLQKVAGKKNEKVVRSLQKKQKQLNQLPEVDYEAVMQFKINVLRELYELDDFAFLEEKEYAQFFDQNKYWLVPYAAFCYLRDKWGTSDFSKWKTHSVFDAHEISRLTAPKLKTFRFIAFYYFVQYHLHLQLKEAVDYAHKKGLALKGDIPIGIYRYGCDAWMAPELYNMNMQAGAPPDDFAVKGQNWGFPTYNWKEMEENHFEWWRRRFQQMSNYFDAFRIDHILGFFRIWSIPVDAVEGILGRFIPALPVSVSEFGERGIWFNYNRYCRPFINDAVLQQVFNDQAAFVRNNFIDADESGYRLKENFDTQRKIEDYFKKLEATDLNNFLKQGLFDLVSNVILIEEPGSEQQQFHFRIAMQNTTSFQHLEEGTRNQLDVLYIDYFYRRQDAFWKQEALKKLPALKDATNMLICGEDLGMVPHSVPEVMKQLGILSLEIQRMPKNPETEFFNPKDAPYLSVVTPSSHDMSTIRGWWEESREKTQRFYNTMLNEQGTAPYFCEPWINRAIVLQHLYAPAMWSIFQLQDLLGMSGDLRRENPADERINIPANPSHYWNYRMHLGLEQLLKETSFNNELKDYIKNSGRGA